MTIFKIQVTFHWHALTFCSEFRLGVEEIFFKEYFGHSAILKQTMIYVHIVQTDANAEIFYSG
jgi:cell division protein FtsB